MKIVYLSLALVYLGGILGCAEVRATRNARAAIAEIENQSQPAKPAVKPVKRAIPATEASATSPVARSVAGIVHLMEAGGVICLLACAALCYFGQYIPGVKCGIAGISLPVCAIWFNYHYGLVIALVLISAALAFLWGFYKEDPQDFALVETKLLELENSIVTRVTGLFHPSVLVPAQPAK